LIDELFCSGDEITEMVWNEEPGIYEQQLSTRVYQTITDKYPNIKISTSMDCTLYHPNDLPYGGTEWDQLIHPPKKKNKKNNNNKGRHRNNINDNNNNDNNNVSQKMNQQYQSKNYYYSTVDISISRWKGMPRVMGDFRKAAREKTRPRPCYSNIPPDNIMEPLQHHNIPVGDIPTIESLLQPILLMTKEDKPILGLSIELIHEICHHATRQYNNANNEKKRFDLHYFRKGGETFGLKHLEDFCTNYASTAQRNVACVDDYQSSRFSHYLAFGCLSPRKIAETAEKQKDDSCNWIISHMTMRDFFLYTCLATGDQFYSRNGIPVNKKAAESITWKSFDDDNTMKVWKFWATGETGLPLVDAAMKELIQTGYCSNRVRQNAASVLTKDLEIDWRAGAEWFQFLLCDHCVGANWGNWLYFSGMGSDPKNRHFRTVSQALKYDRDGTFVKKWCPELGSVDTSNDREVHLRPWDFPEEVKWKFPIVPPETQYTWNDQEQMKQSGTIIPKTYVQA
jgi:deoxyribodipyrimidine photo-lyase